ncbi:MAG: nitroreductase family protein [Burkholderiales bacterium]|nr:nitroreductase family protein [Burkholderiales bacterium]
MNKPLAGLDYEALMNVVRRRRSVRAFEKGRRVGRDVLEKIVECGRWAPSGANAQPWDFIVVDEPGMKEKVFKVFMRQSQRLIDHAKGFPAVKKSYMANTVAIIVVVGDPRWKSCFPQGTSPEFVDEYAANNEKIYLVSLGAAIQNLQLGVTAMGLTSAWLSGGGEATTNRDLSELLGYPPNLEAVGTIPVGYPQKNVSLRYRRPLAQVLHWNRYEPEKFRRQAQIDYYLENLRPFAMYRDVERMQEWEDTDEKLGPWKDAFTTATPNPGGKLDR